MRDQPRAGAEESSEGSGPGWEPEAVGCMSGVLFYLQNDSLTGLQCPDLPAVPAGE